MTPSQSGIRGSASDFLLGAVLGSCVSVGLSQAMFPTPGQLGLGPLGVLVAGLVIAPFTLARRSRPLLIGVAIVGCCALLLLGEVRGRTAANDWSAPVQLGHAVLATLLLAAAAWLGRPSSVQRRRHWLAFASSAGAATICLLAATWLAIPWIDSWTEQSVTSDSEDQSALRIGTSGADIPSGGLGAVDAATGKLRWHYGLEGVRLTDWQFSPDRATLMASFRLSSTDESTIQRLVILDAQTGERRFWFVYDAVVLEPETELALFDSVLITREDRFWDDRDEPGNDWVALDVRTGVERWRSGSIPDCAQIAAESGPDAAKVRRWCRQLPDPT